LTRVDKPALLRRLFRLACDFSGQVVSYQKMLGQLQDAGNTTTLAHYLDLLEGAGMIVGLPKYSGGRVRQRGSSPKLQVMNNALMTATSDLTLDEARKERDYWGRLVEYARGSPSRQWRPGHGHTSLLLAGAQQGGRFCFTLGALRCGY
jgi:uncharacterized protein